MSIDNNIALPALCQDFHKKNVRDFSKPQDVQAAFESLSLSSVAEGHDYITRKDIEFVLSIAANKQILNVELDTLIKVLGYRPRAKKGDVVTSLTGKRVLVIPASTGEGITSFQMIAEDGRKANLKEARLNGGWFEVEPIASPTLIRVVEGFSTACSVHKATYENHPEDQPRTVLVVSSFGLPNISTVIKNLHDKYPEARVTYGSDLTKNSAEGTLSFSQAELDKAVSVNAAFAYPRFNDPQGKGKDFNDLAISDGLAAVRAAFEAAERSKVKADEAARENSYNPRTPKATKKSKISDHPQPSVTPPSNDPADIRVLPGGLRLDSSGKVKANDHKNIASLMRHIVTPFFKIDEFNDTETSTTKPIWREGKAKNYWKQRDDISAVLELISDWFDVNIPLSLVKQFFPSAREENAFNSAQDSVKADLEAWDGKRRLAKWVAKYMGAWPGHEQYQEILGIHSIRSYVARVMEPGCEQPLVMVIQGSKGLGKSFIARAIGTAFGAGAFSNTLADLHSKDSLQGLIGKAIIELDELKAFARSSEEEVRSFLTSRSDNVRVQYTDKAKDFLRTANFIGTVNAATPFKDRLGDRRFWPTKMTKKLSKADIDEFEVEIHQLIGEAAHDILIDCKSHLVENLDHIALAARVQSEFIDSNDIDNDMMNAAYRLLSGENCHCPDGKGIFYPERHSDYVLTASMLKLQGIQPHFKTARDRATQLLLEAGFTRKRIAIPGLGDRVQVYFKPKDNFPVDGGDDDPGIDKNTNDSVVTSSAIATDVIPSAINITPHVQLLDPQKPAQQSVTTGYATQEESWLPPKTHSINPDPSEEPKIDYSTMPPLEDCYDDVATTVPPKVIYHGVPDTKDVEQRASICANCARSVYDKNKAARVCMADKNLTRIPLLRGQRNGPAAWCGGIKFVYSGTQCASGCCTDHVTRGGTCKDINCFIDICHDYNTTELPNTPLPDAVLGTPRTVPIKMPPTTSNLLHNP